MLNSRRLFTRWTFHRGGSVFRRKRRVGAKSWQAGSTAGENFVDSCEPEVSKEDMDERIAYRKSLPWKELQELLANEKWSLDSWLYWLEPENRTWFWWDAALLEEPIRETYFIVAVVILEWPFPWGALKWLFKACGALDVVSEEDL